MNYCLSSTAVGPNRWGNGTYRERMLLTVTACGHRPPRASFTGPFPERRRYSAQTAPKYRQDDERNDAQHFKA